MIERGCRQRDAAESNVRLDLSSAVARVEQQVTAALVDEIIVLNMNDSKYDGLDEIGAFIRGGAVAVDSRAP
jgi:hypothetical protein